MTFNLLQPIYPLSYEEHTAMVVFINGRGPEEDIPMLIASLRFEKQLRETTHFYHGVGTDVDNNVRWYVMAHLGGAHAATATGEFFYGEHGDHVDKPLPDADRKAAEDHVFAKLRADFFTALGLEEFIG